MKIKEPKKKQQKLKASENEVDYSTKRRWNKSMCFVKWNIK